MKPSGLYLNKAEAAHTQKWDTIIYGKRVSILEFSEKLILLRKKAGISQAQLADRLGLTRQSVSKWESGAAFPELVKLISLSDIFGVSLDYLVRDSMENPEEVQPDTARLEQKLDALANDCRKSCGPYYRYTSKAHIGRLPLVSIRFGRDRHPSSHTLAVGVIAIGNFAVGVVSFGLISLGGISLGLIAVGGLSVGMVTLGIIALGITAVGVYAGGVSAVGSEIAVGIAAVSGDTAVGCDASAEHVLLCADEWDRTEIETFLRGPYPRLWRPLLRLFSVIGALF